MLMTDAELYVWKKLCVSSYVCVLAWQRNMKLNPRFGCLLSLSQ